MSPIPIPPNTVHITLQYISPPSQLERPLPPYLLSKSLLQRHHFLNISSDDPEEYLCWPSDTASKAVDLLESYYSPSEDELPSYPVQYTSDDEHTYAHVSLSEADSDGLRLVFQWEPFDGWKFHDAKLMPFPPDSKPSLGDSLAAPTSMAAPAIAFQSSNYEDDGNDDDDYWNAYGADSESPSPTHHLPSAKDASGDSEDAYWAQYSSVHGTADSTVPSPPIQRRRPHPFGEIPSDHGSPLPVRLGTSDGPDEMLPIPPMVSNRIYTSSRWEPASPSALARLLADITPRSPAPVSEYEEEPVFSPTQESSDDSDTPSPPDVLGLITEVGEPMSSVVRTSLEKPSLGENEAMPDEDVEPFQQSLKGLFSLWKMTRANKGISSEEQDKESFMSVVEEVIGM